MKHSIATCAAMISICTVFSARCMFLSSVARARQSAARYTRYSSPTVSPASLSTAKTRIYQNAPGSVISTQPTLPTPSVRMFHATTPTPGVGSFFGDLFNRARGKPTTAERKKALSKEMFNMLDAFINTPAHSLHALSDDELLRSINQNRFAEVLDTTRNTQVTTYKGEKKMVQSTILDDIFYYMLPPDFFMEYDPSVPYKKEAELSYYMRGSPQLKQRFVSLSKIAKALIDKGAHCAPQKVEKRAKLNIANIFRVSLSKSVTPAFFEYIVRPFELLAYAEEYKHITGNSDTSAITYLVKDYLYKIRSESFLLRRVNADAWKKIIESAESGVQNTVREVMSAWHREEIMMRHDGKTSTTFIFRYRKDPNTGKETTEKYNTATSSWEPHGSSSYAKQEESQQQSSRQESRQEQSQQPIPTLEYEKAMKTLEFPPYTKLESLTEAMVKNQHHPLAWKYHPDVLKKQLLEGEITQNDMNVAENKLKIINAAYDLLIRFVQSKTKK
jgi:hypothetical protein